MLGDLSVDSRKGTFVTAHIIRDFSDVDPARYHAAVRLQAESVPLNVATTNTATRVVESLGQASNEEDSVDVFFDAESETTASSGLKAKGNSSRFDSSADLFEFDD